MGRAQTLDFQHYNIKTKEKTKWVVVFLYSFLIFNVNNIKQNCKMTGIDPKTLLFWSSPLELSKIMKLPSRAMNVVYLRMLMDFSHNYLILVYNDQSH